ncbi:MAG: LptA/OstA family protein [Pseudomonadota bacterium]|nr:LptA/OstA family protein [Pseudomonadota bacterium]
MPPLESNGGSPEVTLTADKASLLRSGLSEFEGSVVVTQGDKRLSAESLSYEEADERVRVDAESLFQSKEMVVRSRTADLYLGRETGVFMGTEFTLIDSAARGNAERLELLGETRARLDAVEYTTCAPGHEDWVLKASRVHLDREEGLGSARNARLHFAGVPIL